MSVYVDPLRRFGGGPQCFREGSCHLFADTVEELHTFAARIGMRRAWFQDHASVPHYDLTRTKRNRAVRLGAIELPTRESVAKWKDFRRTGP